MPRRRASARWLRAPQPDAAQVRALEGALRLPRALCELLVARGLSGEADARRYLRPQLDQLHAPGLLKDLDIAVERLGRASFVTGQNLQINGGLTLRRNPRPEEIGAAIGAAMAAQKAS